MTEAIGWNRYLDALIAELPVLARSIATQAHEHVRELLDDAAHIGSRQELLAMDRLLQTPTTHFSDTLADALRLQVVDGRRESMRELNEPSPQDDARTALELEQARTVGLVESIAYWELRELQGLCASLRRARSIGPEQNPLRPQMCVRALLIALEDAGFDEPTRITALRAAGSPLALVLRDFYVQQCRRLVRRDAAATTASIPDRLDPAHRPGERRTPR